MPQAVNVQLTHCIPEMNFMQISLHPDKLIVYTNNSVLVVDKQCWCHTVAVLTIIFLTSSSDLVFAWLGR